MNPLIVREGARRVDTCPPCSGDCRQGRECKTRQACELPIDDDGLSFWDSLLWAGRWVGVVLLTLFVLFLSAGYASAWWPRLVDWMAF